MKKGGPPIWCQFQCPELIPDPNAEVMLSPLDGHMRLQLTRRLVSRAKRVILDTWTTSLPGFPRELEGP